MLKFFSMTTDAQRTEIFFSVIVFQPINVVSI